MRRALIDIALAVGLFWLCHAQYRAATGYIQLCDSGYALAISERFLQSGSVDLSPAIPNDRKKLTWYSPYSDLPYQLVKTGTSAVYYGYPLGSSVLSLPFVRGYLHRGRSVFHPSGTLDPEAEGLIQQRIAAKVSAALVVVIYGIFRFFVPPYLAAVLSLGFGFGSPIFSTLSRSLWSHTWHTLLLALAVLVLIVARRYRGRAYWACDLPIGLLLGTLSFWAIIVRPHGIISLAAIGVYLLVWHRRLIPSALVAGVIWLIGFVLVSLHAFESPTPPSVYSAGAIDGRDVWNRFAWLMISPSRELLVFCPYLIFVAGLLMAYRRQLTDRPLLVPAVLTILGYLGVFSAYDGWHAGSSFGPRYFSDLIPWFALLTAQAAGAMLACPADVCRKVIGFGLLLATFLWAGFVHYRGANSIETWEWNYLSIPMGQDGSVKDWRHPQFLAGLTFRLSPDGSVLEVP